MGHISDRTLDNLLDGSIDDASELAIEEHVRHCDRCAHRLREWELLFPQLKSLIPTGEHPVVSGDFQVAAAGHAPRPHAPNVFIPDWTPPRLPHALPIRLAWGLVAVLALGAGYLMVKKSSDDTPSIAYLPGTTYDQAVESMPGDTVGLGSGISTPTDIRTVAVESVPAPVTPEPALTQTVDPPREEPRTEPAPPPQVAAGQSQEQDVRVPSPGREAPVQFPIKVDPRAKQPETQSGQVDAPATNSATQPALSPQFQRVTLGEAISRLSGTVRLIEGLNPETVEIAQGTALPGADPGKAVVRVVYNAPEGRLILDQQRVSRGGAREPSIAISTAPNGVSVAQWVDRGGFWISLAGRADQQTLLMIANRIK